MSVILPVVILALMPTTSDVVQFKQNLTFTSIDACNNFEANIFTGNYRSNGPLLFLEIGKCKEESK